MIVRDAKRQILPVTYTKHKKLSRTGVWPLSWAGMIAPGSKSVKTRCLFAPAVNQTNTAAFKGLFKPHSKESTRLTILIAHEVFTMRRTLTVLGLTTLLAAAAASFVVLPNGTSRAAAMDNDLTFIISADDGYGLGDCLASGNDCGKIVANAWCEAHGYRRAESFGLSADTVASAAHVRVSVEADRPVTITCAN